MPTVFIEGPYRFYFFSREETRKHIHVISSEGELKIWLEPEISIDDFFKADLRVAKIVKCEKVKKSKKLLKFTLDDGSGTPRTILSGIQAWYQPEDLIGKQVLFVANFAPRKMMGEESQGMILSAVNYDGTLSVTTTSADVKPGSIVG